LIQESELRGKKVNRKTNEYMRRGTHEKREFKNPLERDC
jgi:hypothetical protein